MIGKPINLMPAELQAILEHKRVLSLLRGVEVGLEEAIEHFVEHVEMDWRLEKQRRDLAEEREEIEKHKFLCSEREGRDIGRSRAAEEWCEKYAPIWRADHESLERNGFFKVSVVVPEGAAFHVKPASTLAMLAQQFDCDVYLHREGMEYFNFVLQGRRYLNVKSVLGLLTVAARPGERLDLIASGPRAREALQAMAAAITRRGAPEGVQSVPGSP